MKLKIFFLTFGLSTLGSERVNIILHHSFVLVCHLCLKMQNLHKIITNLLIFFPQERHKALEEMGISVQSSGIAVEKSKFYLVNLNADPSMNELLVYYLKVTL